MTTGKGKEYKIGEKKTLKATGTNKEVILYNKAHEMH